ncbi:MAG: TIGR03545 family protein, partial [Bdellovibrionaceae bacterium]|nr:TIGR03545 family protein [Pseudobdellovibrionaceae bacterium]
AMSWDALLRGKILINELSVEEIGIDIQRKRRGKVAPPEPPSENEGTQSDLLSEAWNQAQSKALGMVAEQHESNIAGDIAQLIQGGFGPEKLLNEIKSNLKTENHLLSLKSSIDTKKEFWEKKIKELPSYQEIQNLVTQSQQIKTKDFKSLEEINQSIEQFKKVHATLNTYLNQYDQAWKTLEKDTKSIHQDVKLAETYLKNDLQIIQNYLQLPKIDMRTIAKAIVMDQMRPYLAQLGYYRNMLLKYMPPNLRKKKEPDEIEIAMQPRPRKKGVTYEFSRPGSYPLFWIKKVSISSVANPAKNIGNLKGVVENITSNQALIQKPTTLTFQGDFPHLKIDQVSFNGVFDNRGVNTQIDYNLQIGPYPFEQTTLLQTPHVNIFTQPAQATLHSKGSLKGFTDLQITIQKKIANCVFRIEASDVRVQNFLTQVFSDINTVNFNLNISGHLPKPALSFTSDIGELLSQNMMREFKKSFEMIKKQALDQFHQSIAQQRENIQSQLKNFENTIHSEIGKHKSFLDTEKNRIDTEIKSAENQIKSQLKQNLNVNTEKLDSEIKRATDELKKKLGF